MKETCFVQLMLSERPLWLLREESCERPWVCLCWYNRQFVPVVPRLWLQSLSLWEDDHTVCGKIEVQNLIWLGLLDNTASDSEGSTRSTHWQMLISKS